MTGPQASALAARALPCPFCGERLVARSDHHGWWVAHQDEPGECECGVTQIMSESDLARWNTRAKPPSPDLTQDGVSRSVLA